MKANDSGRVLDFCKIYSRGNLWLTACVLLLGGLVLACVALDDEPLLRQEDAATGLTIRMVLLVAGIMFLALSVYLFAARSLMMKGLLVCWLSLNLIIWRVALFWMHVPNPSPAVIVAGWKMGIWPRILDRYFIALIVYLALGGILATVLEWRSKGLLRRGQSIDVQTTQNLAA